MGRGHGPLPTPLPHWGGGYPLPKPPPYRRLDSRVFGARRSGPFLFIYDSNTECAQNVAQHTFSRDVLKVTYVKMC